MVSDHHKEAEEAESQRAQPEVLRRYSNLTLAFIHKHGRTSSNWTNRLVKTPPTPCMPILSPFLPLPTPTTAATRVVR